MWILTLLNMWYVLPTFTWPETIKAKSRTPPFESCLEWCIRGRKAIHPKQRNPPKKSGFCGGILGESQGFHLSRWQVIETWEDGVGAPSWALGPPGSRRFKISVDWWLWAMILQSLNISYYWGITTIQWESRYKKQPSIFQGTLFLDEAFDVVMVNRADDYTT